MAARIVSHRLNVLAVRLNGTENRPKMLGNLANVGLKHLADRDPSTITVFVGWLSHHLLLNQINKEETPMEKFVEPIELNDAELDVVRGGFTLGFGNFGLNTVGSIRSESEHVNTAATEHRRSESSGVATHTMPEAALMDEGQVHASCAPGLSVSPETGSCRTEEPQDSKGPLLDETRPDDWIQRLGTSLPRSGCDIVRAASARIFTGREVALHSGDIERVRRGKFSSIAKRITFLVVYMVAVSSASIASFLILRGDRDTEPTTTHVQSNVSIEAESVTTQNPAEDHSEAVLEPSIQEQQVGSADSSHAPKPSLPVEPNSALSSSAQKVEPDEDHFEAVLEPLIQERQVGSADSSHAPKPSLPVEPDSALSSPAQKVEVESQDAALAGRPEASQRPEPGQPDGIAQLIEQLDHQAAETPDPAHEPIPLAEQSPTAAPAGSAETAPHSDAAQSDAGKPTEASPKNEAQAEAQAAATVPTENVSAALHSRAHTAETRKASAPRRYAEPKRRVLQQTPARDPQPVSDGQLPRSYPNSDRGYGYGGPAATSDTGG